MKPTKLKQMNESPKNLFLPEKKFSVTNILEKQRSGRDSIRIPDFRAQRPIGHRANVFTSGTSENEPDSCYDSINKARRNL